MTELPLLASKRAASADPLVVVDLGVALLEVVVRAGRAVRP
jgi:hypothetical protein